jgi:anti-sigma factor RsiW
MAPGSLATFSTTFALAGIGKLPNSPLTLIVRLARAGPAWLTEAKAEAEAEVRAAGLVAAVLAVVVPAVHAVSDRPAAHAVRATAAERYVFMGFLSRRLSEGEDVQALNLEGGHSGRVAIVSQVGDIGRS